jgi:hypothetical protein
MNEFDLAFAVSITDEILLLEPMEDKLTVLKRKQEFRPVAIVSLLLQRVSFFALFNLFDTVEHNQLDSQASMQKVWLHLKNQETEIQALKQYITSLESLARYLDEDKQQAVDQSIRTVGTLAQEFRALKHRRTTDQQSQTAASSEAPLAAQR